MGCLWLCQMLLLRKFPADHFTQMPEDLRQSLTHLTNLETLCLDWIPPGWRKCYGSDDSDDFIIQQPPCCIPLPSGLVDMQLPNFGGLNISSQQVLHLGP